MASVAERRKAKLLAREAALSGSNPVTKPAPVELSQQTKEWEIVEEVIPVQVIAPTPVKEQKVEKVDFKKLN